MTTVVIVSAARTPIGTFEGKLASVPSYVLGSVVIEEILKRAKVDKADVSEIIIGQVLTAGQGQNPARHAALLAGIPKEVPAMTINQVCGSGLRSIALATQAIRCGDSRIVVAGGQESMSLAPHCMHMRKGVKMGNSSFIDTMVEDGLIDCIHKCTMATTAENIAQQKKILRQKQDEVSLASQRKAAVATQTNKFKEEIIPVTVKSRKATIVVDTDEFPKPSTTMESLLQLPPIAADKSKGIEGTVTAGNATGLNNGAAAVLVMSQEEADKRGLQPMARIVSWAHAGVEPLTMGLGPIPAASIALKKAGWNADDVDLFEINEAFACQAAAVVDELKISWDKVNVNGGAIALGHPIGASGSRILVTLLYAMKDRKVTKGLATLCVGGGMGVAVCVERD